MVLILFNPPQRHALWIAELARLASFGTEVPAQIALAVQGNKRVVDLVGVIDITLPVLHKRMKRAGWASQRREIEVFDARG
jgi:hypothetical protein